MMFDNISLLLVEDEPNLGDTLYEYLSSKGFQVRHAINCAQARALFAQKDFQAQVVLMDVGLPDGSGIDLAKEFLKERPGLALLFLSAQNDAQIKFEGLSMGAEDYITKPFDLRELTLRLTKALKYHQDLAALGDEIELGDLKIWFHRYQVLDGKGEVQNLGQKEHAILQLLYQNRNQVISRDDIINKVWGENSFPSNRTVDNYIVKIRKWLESSKAPHARIISVRGIGYKFEMLKS